VSDLRKQLFGCRRNCPGHHGKQLAGSHSNQREKVFGGFIFCFRLRRKFPQVLHHGVGIDLAGRTDLALKLVFELVFPFAFSEQAANHVADGTEPTFTFQAGLVFHLILIFEFAFVFPLVFEFQFIFELVRHDDSSCEKWSDNARLRGCLTQNSASALEPCPHAAAGAAVSTAHFGIAADCSGTGFGAAKHSANLPSGGVSCAASSDSLAFGGLPFQRFYGSTHDRRHCLDSDSSLAAPPENASKNRCPSHKVRENTP
jgi:hypothetical protein